MKNRDVKKEPSEISSYNPETDTHKHAVELLFAEIYNLAKGLEETEKQEGQRKILDPGVVIELAGKFEAASKVLGLSSAQLRSELISLVKEKNEADIIFLKSFMRILESINASSEDFKYE